MKIKVCGMKHPENISAIEKLQPDFMGFIFYEKSPRYVDIDVLKNLSTLNNEICKVGVFVNASVSMIAETAELLTFDYVQLHGNETPEFTRELNGLGIRIIKAFQIKEDFNWNSLKPYQEWVNYFLFDTPTEHYGGSGKKFNWEVLSKYNDNTPFFLSGGIGPEDIQEIKKLKLPFLFGIDVNSKFETEPGRKDELLIKTMINQVRNESKL